MSRGRLGAAVNATRTEITDYAPDPRGWGLFAALSAVAQAQNSGLAARPYTGDRGAPERSYNGDLAHSLQNFLGQAALGVGLGGGRPYRGQSDLSQEVSSATITDPAMRIFAARLRRNAFQTSGGSQ